MSDTKVPKGWATPNAPPPQSVRGSVVAGLAALALTVGGGLFIAKNVSSKGAHSTASHDDNRAKGSLVGAKDSKRHQVDAHAAIQKSANAAAARAKELAAQKALEEQELNLLKQLREAELQKEKEAKALLEKEKEADVASKTSPPPELREKAKPADAEGALKDLDMPMLPIERKTKKWLEKGNQHIEAKRFRSAIGEFRKVLKSDSKRAEAHRGMGIAYARLGKVDKARRSYKRYIELAPDAPDAPDVRRLLGQ